jgi:hypothetical protein
VVGLEVVHCVDFLLGDNQDVGGRLRIYVPERQHVLVFEYDVSRNLPADDFQKKIIGHFLLRSEVLDKGLEENYPVLATSGYLATVYPIQAPTDQ